MHRPFQGFPNIRWPENFYQRPACPLPQAGWGEGKKVKNARGARVPKNKFCPHQFCSKARSFWNFLISSRKSVFRFQKFWPGHGPHVAFPKWAQGCGVSESSALLVSVWLALV